MHRNQTRLYVNKLIDNTITEDEIETCTNLIDSPNTNKYDLLYLFNLFSEQFLSTNDVSLMKNIYQKFPLFIHQYIGFFLKSSFLFGYDWQHSIDDRFLDVFEIMVNNDIIPLTYIAQQLNEAPKLSCFYCNKIANRFPKLLELIPEKIAQLRQLENSIHQLFADPKICLPAAWASVKVGDAANPRITKFGGVRPYLPSEGPVECSKCHDQCCMICQIYVPSTPQWFQDQFPLDNRNILIAAYYFNSCYLNVETRTFTEAELDSVVYIDDVVYRDGGTFTYTFNSPRLVLEWTTGSMVPQQCNRIYDALSVNLLGGDEDTEMIIDDYFEF